MERQSEQLQSNFRWHTCTLTLYSSVWWPHRDVSDYQPSLRRASRWETVITTPRRLSTDQSRDKFSFQLGLFYPKHSKNESHLSNRSTDAFSGTLQVHSKIIPGGILTQFQNPASSYLLGMAWNFILRLTNGISLDTEEPDVCEKVTWRYEWNERWRALLLVVCEVSVVHCSPFSFAEIWTFTQTWPGQRDQGIVYSPLNCGGETTQGCKGARNILQSLNFMKERNLMRRSRK